MLQESKVPETLQVHEVVEMFRRLYESSVSVDHALEASDLENKRHTRVGRLSGGERQPLYFALCVLSKTLITTKEMVSETTKRLHIRL